MFSVKKLLSSVFMPAEDFTTLGHECLFTVYGLSLELAGLYAEEAGRILARAARAREAAYAAAYPSPCDLASCLFCSRSLLDIPMNNSSLDSSLEGSLDRSQDPSPSNKPDDISQEFHSHGSCHRRYSEAIWEANRDERSALSALAARAARKD